MDIRMDIEKSLQAKPESEIDLEATEMLADLLEAAQHEAEQNEPVLLKQSRRQKKEERKQNRLYSREQEREKARALALERNEELAAMDFEADRLAMDSYDEELEDREDRVRAEQFEEQLITQQAEYEEEREEEKKEDIKAANNWLDQYNNKLINDLLREVDRKQETKVLLAELDRERLQERRDGGFKFHELTKGSHQKNLKNMARDKLKFYRDMNLDLKLRQLASEQKKAVPVPQELTANSHQSEGAKDKLNFYQRIRLALQLKKQKSQQMVAVPEHEASQSKNTLKILKAFEVQKGIYQPDNTTDPVKPCQKKLLPDSSGYGSRQYAKTEWVRDSLWSEKENALVSEDDSLKQSQALQRKW